MIVNVDYSCLEARGALNSETWGSETTVVNIDDAHGLIILHPDVLISPTRVTDSINCIRKGVLSDRVACLGGSSTHAVLGTAKHRVIESILSSVYSGSCSSFDPKSMDDQAVEEVVQKIATEFGIEIIAAGLAIINVLVELRQTAQNVLKWARDQTNNIKICKILSDEEVLWSPMVGLKGQIDMIASVCHNSDELVVPIEIKTGKKRPSTYVAHRAQVCLYCSLAIHGLFMRDLFK